MQRDDRAFPGEGAGESGAMAAASLMSERSEQHVGDEEVDRDDEHGGS